MSAIEGNNNYISDGDIMAWLATEQDRIYGQLSDAMDLSDKRAKFADDLNNIKAELQQANASGDFRKVDADLQSFVNAYGSDPQLGDLCNGLDDMAAKIHSDLQGQTPPELQVYTQPPSSDAATMNARLNLGGGQLLQPIRPEQPNTDAGQHYSDADMQAWKDLITGKLDSSSKNDQLTMIHIQELKATLDQGTQLGSTYIASDDKTVNAIINNFV